MAVTTTLVLIRHGQTASNVEGYFMGWSDIPLNETGRMQAKKLAERLKDQRIDVLYSSPLMRAFETAEMVAKEHGLTPKPLPELKEMNYGDWQGLKRADIRQKYPELWKKLLQFDPDMCFPGGESYRELIERSIRAYDIIVKAEEGKIIAAVSHQGFLRPLVMHVLGAHHSVCPKIEFGNTSVSVVKITDGNARLVSLNDMCHLEDKRHLD